MPRAQTLIQNPSSPGVLVWFRPVHKAVVRHILYHVKLGESLRRNRGRRRICALHPAGPLHRGTCRCVSKSSPLKRPMVTAANEVEPMLLTG